MPPLGSSKWFDILGWMVGFGLLLLVVGGLGFLLLRYTLHPQQYRDVHYQITRVVYVIASKRPK